jgi:repressor LexA
MHAQTRRQREVLDFITRYIESHGYRPSYQVIARHMGVSSRAGIGRIVRDLEHQGFLERRRVDGHFAIALTRDNGRHAEGLSIEWLHLPTSDGVAESPFCVPEFMLGGIDPAAVRALRVRDDAMAECAICRGDIALIELRTFARDGDVVAAIVKKRELMLRKYFRRGAEVELCEADIDGESMWLAADKVEVLGVYKGLLRPLS